MQKRPSTGQHWVWAGLLATVLLGGCGGGNGGAQPGVNPEPSKTLSIRLNGPAQVRSGEALQIDGSLDQGSALAAQMEWLLLERPAGSQATLSAGQSSSQMLRTDRPGRYLVQWTVVGASGERVQRQLAVEAVDGPLIQTSTPADQLQLGKVTVLQAQGISTETGGPTTYRWSLLQGPSGSKAQLSGTWGSEVGLNADVAGPYQVQVEAHQGSTVTRTVKTLQASAASTIKANPTAWCTPLLGCTRAVGVPIRLWKWTAVDIGDAKVDYKWVLLSMPDASRVDPLIGSGDTAVLVPDATGIYTVALVPTGNGLNITGGIISFEVRAKPTGTIQAPSSVKVGDIATLDASAHRTVDGQEIGRAFRAWTLLQAPKGSSTVIQQADSWDPTATLRPDRPGDYVISLSYADVADYATVTVRASSVDSLIVYPPKVIVALSPLVPGEELQFKAESPSEPGHEILHEWKFGDGSSATGDTVKHSFSYPGTYLVQVIARDTATQRFARQTISITVVANRIDNIPPMPCGEANCPAAAADRYSGKGVGRWQLVNDQPHAQVVNIDIAGISTGQQVLVSLSNASGNSAGIADLGTSEGMGARPLPGALAQAARLSTSQPQNTLLSRHDEAHAEHLARSRAAAAALQGSGGNTRAGSAGRRSIQSASLRAALPVPDLGSGHDWRDATGGGSYNSRLIDSCSLPNGRKVLFWLDEQARVNDLTTAGQVADDLKPMVCGEQGGFQRLQQLLGVEVFGLHERTDIISDAALQPVQILIADPGADTGWGAYVYSGDLVRKSSLPVSNEAVLMVVNARYIKTDLNFIKSSLVHEFMHQINNFQRWVLGNGGFHDSWLEETTAMMAEDLVSSTLITKADGSRYVAMAGRMASYQAIFFPGQFLGGEGTNYSIGGSLAGYLDRRLGAGLLRGLTLDCPNEAQPQGSLRCLDDQVFLRSGKGVAEHYGAMNVSVMGPLQATDGPDLGMPAFADDEIDLPAIDLKALGQIPREQLATPWRLYPGAHIYQWESATAAAGGHYRRKGITVPPGHVLQIVIR